MAQRRGVRRGTRGRGVAGRYDPVARSPTTTTPASSPVARPPRGDPHPGGLRAARRRRLRGDLTRLTRPGQQRQRRPTDVRRRLLGGAVSLPARLDAALAAGPGYRGRRLGRRLLQPLRRPRCPPPERRRRAARLRPRSRPPFACSSRRWPAFDRARLPGPHQGVELVTDTRRGGRPITVRLAEFFAPSRALRVECAAPRAAFTARPPRFSTAAAQPPPRSASPVRPIVLIFPSPPRPPAPDSGSPRVRPPARLLPRPASSASTPDGRGRSPPEAHACAARRPGHRGLRARPAAVALLRTSRGRWTHRRGHRHGTATRSCRRASRVPSSSSTASSPLPISASPPPTRSARSTSSGSSRSPAPPPM